MSSLVVARYSLLLLLRHSVVALFLGGALSMVAASFILTYLTPGTERRTFFNLVYLGVELMAVLVPVLGSTVLRIMEFEQKTIWLVLTRPVTRSGYVLGRFLGLTAVTWTTLAGVVAVLAALAGTAGALPEPFLGPVIWAAFLETIVVGALCTLFSLLSTSYLVALVLSAGFVVAGYLSSVLPHLADKFGSAVLSSGVNVLYWLLPHLDAFSVRDFASPPEPWYLWLLGLYAVAFGGGVLALTCFLFQRRET